MASQKNTKGKRKSSKTYTKDDKGRAEKFVDFGQKRVSKAIKAVRQIANLSNKASYGYSEEQVKRMFQAVRDSVDAAEQRFSGKKEAAAEFSF